jgi:hypothetical protein
LAGLMLFRGAGNAGTDAELLEKSVAIVQT